MATITVLRSLDREQLFWYLDPVPHDPYVRHYEEWLSTGSSSLWLTHRKAVIDYYDFNPVSAIEARIDFGFNNENTIKGSSPYISNIISQNIPKDDFLLRIYQIKPEATSFIIYFKHPEDAMLFSIANER